jgi:hypothetical protein
VVTDNKAAAKASSLALTTDSASSPKGSLFSPTITSGVSAFGSGVIGIEAGVIGIGAGAVSGAASREATNLHAANNMLNKAKINKNKIADDIANDITDAIDQVVKDNQVAAKKISWGEIGDMAGDAAYKTGKYGLYGVGAILAGSLGVGTAGLLPAAYIYYNAQPSIKINSDIDKLTAKLKEGIKPINKVTSIVKEIYDTASGTTGPSGPSAPSDTSGTSDPPSPPATDITAAAAEAEKIHKQEIREAENRGERRAQQTGRILDQIDSEYEASKPSSFSDKEKEYYMAKLGLYVPNKEGKNIFYNIGLPLTKNTYEHMDSDFPRGTSPENFFSSLFSEVKSINLPIVKNIFPSSEESSNLERSILNGTFKIDINGSEPSEMGTSGEGSPSQGSSTQGRSAGRSPTPPDTPSLKKMKTDVIELNAAKAAKAAQLAQLAQAAPAAQLAPGASAATSKPKKVTFNNVNQVIKIQDHDGQPWFNKTDVENSLAAINLQLQASQGQPQGQVQGQSNI